MWGLVCPNSIVCCFVYNCIPIDQLVLLEARSFETLPTNDHQGLLGRYSDSKSYFGQNGIDQRIHYKKYEGRVPDMDLYDNLSSVSGEPFGCSSLQKALSQNRSASTL